MKSALLVVFGAALGFITLGYSHSDWGAMFLGAVLAVIVGLHLLNKYVED